MDQKIIRETLTIEAAHVTDEDRELGRAFNKVAWEALGWARFYLRNGPDQARLTIVKSFLSASAKLAAADASAELEIHRQTFQTELASMTDVLPAEIEITPAGAIDAATHAPLSDSIYQQPLHPDDETRGP